MATSTEIAIASQTLASPASSITFSAIPGTYTDLRLVLVTKMSANGGNGYLVRFNSNSSGIYSYTMMGSYGPTITISSNNNSASNLDTLGAVSASYPVNINLDLFSYSSTSIYKTMLSQIAGDLVSGGSVEVSANMWRSADAITSITITNNDGFTFSTGAIATLYGIL